MEFKNVKIHITRVLEVLQQDGLGFHMKAALDELHIEVSGLLVREVLFKILKQTNYAGELEKAQVVFDEMITNGQLLNVFTYNAMICGVCMAGKLEEACSMLKDMESRGCNPNLTVYSTLVSYLQNDGKLTEAHEVITHMVEKGQYAHPLSKFKGYRSS
ncbi:hypothetical protein Pyn_17377 [Prunus yedoensis var. nudiflora]|uniref:Pentatricopeptide repeat-containing protein n=1 Tax=Prunus yedoensis var. nudiflora TaxID=2094558 RepID=A0A314YJ58_PRUYE|nr:hypothetical protein Pyn_17377 [Prunus yedoensis var. nudiflora]